MSRKKVEVVELNKKEEEIILEEKQSPLVIFFRRHRWLILLILFLLSLIFLGFSTYIFLNNIGKSENPTIQAAEFETSLDALNNITGSSVPLTEEAARRMFENSNGIFKAKGEVLLVNTVESGDYTIKYYSDGTSLLINKKTGEIIRIAALTNGEYGVNKNGKIDSEAKTSTVTITGTKNYGWGKVTYYSDGSAIVNNSKYDIFVRNSNDINDNYISDNKVSYLQETKTVGKAKLNYYYDGTIEVIINNQSYVVRNVDDLIITGNNVSFKNDNQAKIIKTQKLDDGNTIDYYEDGGAIIRNGSKTISVRKSNSIIIKDNKVFEIVDNIYVTVSKTSDNGNITYYTNGSAVVKYNDEILYIPENSNIKYQGNKITTVGNQVEKLTNETKINDENVKTFEKTAVVKTKDYIAIVPKDSIIYNPNGTIKKITSDIDDGNNKNEFTITNNTGENIEYRIVIEKSSRTDLDLQYIRYQLSVDNKYVGPNKFGEDNLWRTDAVKEALHPTGENYILIDGTLKAYSTSSIRLMLWTDYDTIPNSEQNKYFYGTIRIYAWKKTNKK